MNAFLQILNTYIILGIEIYQFILLLYVLASWFGGLPKNAFGNFIQDLLRPMIQLVQKIPHQFGPIDVSVLYAFVFLEFLRFLVIQAFQIIPSII